MITEDKIHLAFLCVVVLAVCLMAGFFCKPLFLLAGSLWVDKRYLKCPKCGGFENLDRLFYAKNHLYRCRHCGELIKIKTK